MTAAVASWTTEPWLALDVETTGVDCWSDRIVEVASVLVMPDGTARDEYCTIVDPGVEIPDGAAQVHGISTERARDEGINPAEALGEVAQRIFRHGHRPVIGFNMRFDWPILLAEAERHGVEFPFLAPVLDPFLIDRMVDKCRRGPRKLVSVAEHYAIEFTEDDAHGALADAVAAARVMRALVERYPQIGRHSLASVFLRQVRGHERWRQGFVEFKRRSDGDFDIAPGWPLPADGVPVIRQDATQQGAGSDGPDSGGDAGSRSETTPATGPLDAAASDGANSHDVGRTEPEPAPTPLPDASPAPGVEEEGGEPGPATAEQAAAPAPDPEPAVALDERRQAVNAKDVARYAQQVFKAAYDAAPRGDKTKAVERLRHALTYACSGGKATSLNDVDVRTLLSVQARLRDIETGRSTYELVAEGVRFSTVGSPKPPLMITWAQLEQAEAAA